MRTKLNDIYLASLRNDYEVIVATESWLNDSITDAQVFDSRYNIYRRDRASTALGGMDSGGVIIAVKKTLNSCRKPQWESECEDVWVTVNFSGTSNNKDTITVCGVYIQSPVKQNYLDLFLDNANKVMTLSEHKFIICGDFNLSFINWSLDNEDDASVTYLSPSNYQCNMGYSLTDFMSQNNLYQFNPVKNHNLRTLDLVLCNFQGPIVRASTEFLVKIDKHHPPIEIDITTHSSAIPKSKQFATHNFKKADYTTVNQALQEVDWCNQLEGCKNVNAMVDLFYKIIWTIIDKTTVNIIKLIKEKEKIRLRFKHHKNPRDKLELQLMNKRLDSAIRYSYRKYVNSIESSIASNPKKFWSFLKEKRECHRAMPNVILFYFIY